MTNPQRSVALAQHLDLWPIDKLQPYERNARTHSPEQVDKIAASILEFGFTNPILVDSEQGIIAGHGRLMAAQKIGLAEVPVIELTHLSEVQKRAYILADNRLALDAGWDDEMLAAELAQLEVDGFDLDLTGFSNEELEVLLGDVDQIEGKTDDDATPEAPNYPTSVPSDVWILGKHRVMCGDSASLDDVEKLMTGTLAQMVFTDPPYGVCYADKNESLNAADKGNIVQKEILNDHLEGDDLAQFFRSIFVSLYTFMRPGCPFYVCAPQGGEQMMMMMMMMMADAGMPMRHELIWAKNNHVLGRADYHYKHEPILYGWKEGAGHPWYGERNKFSIWNVDKPNSSHLHPTMKPVEIVEIALNNSSKRGDIVLDLFGGSGTTAIACEKTGRAARLMELDPRYCDVIVRRWQDFTGKDAVLEGDGRTFNQMVVDRRPIDG